MLYITLANAEVYQPLSLQLFDNKEPLPNIFVGLEIVA